MPTTQDHAPARTDAGVALTFPGQGVQQVGMGRELSEAFPEARRTFEEADDVLGYGLSRLCFEGPAERLAQTAHCQPAVLTTSVAAWRVAEARGLRGGLALGHSLGEYSALVACGSLSFEEALRLVAARAEITTEVARAEPGGMAALLGVSDDDVEALCAAAGDVWPANYNCPGQVVASGLRRGIERLNDLATAQGVRIRLLEVEGAFHSRVMAPAAERLREAVSSVRIQTPSLPFLSATSAALEKGEQLRALLVQQLTAPVRFTQTVVAALDLGADHFVEFSPRAVLGGLIQRVRPGTRTYRVGVPADLASIHPFLSATA